MTIAKAAFSSAANLDKRVTPKVWAARAAERVRGALTTASRLLVPPNVALLDLALGGWVAQALYTAAKLGIADELAAGPLVAEEVARRVNANPDAVFRLMRALAANSVFAQHADGRFALTSMGEALRSDHPVSVRPMILLACHPKHWQMWGELLYSVRTGEPASELMHGMPFFDYLPSEAEYAEVFNAAMTGLSKMAVEAVLGAYEFNRFDVVADVGGGHGRMLAAVLSSAPGTRGILFDLPSVVAGAAPVLQDAGVASRCEVVGGSFFDAAPAGADCYLLSSVVHDWSEDNALKILANIRAVIPPNGALLLVEMVLPEAISRHYGMILDLEMLVLLRGRERTRAQWADLLRMGGFRLTRVVETVGPFGVIEAAPA